jgi:hypothetical protein
MKGMALVRNGCGGRGGGGTGPVLSSTPIAGHVSATISTLLGCALPSLPMLVSIASRLAGYLFPVSYAMSKPSTLLLFGAEWSSSCWAKAGRGGEIIVTGVVVVVDLCVLCRSLERLVAADVVATDEFATGVSVNFNGSSPNTGVYL